MEKFKDIVTYIVLNAVDHNREVTLTDLIEIATTKVLHAAIDEISFNLSNELKEQEKYKKILREHYFDL